MKPESCGTNRIRWGQSCIQHELPNLGTNYVPSVENKAGCDHIYGIWDNKHGVCIWGLHPYGGWTAPIKGIYFSWMHGPTVALKSKYQPKNVPYEQWWKDIIKNPTKMAEVKACHVYGDPFYGGVGGGSLSGGECYHWLINKTLHNTKGAKDALEMAQKVKNGQAHEIGLKYYTKEGKLTTHRGREVVASDNGSTVRMIYDNLNLERQAPFSFRFRRK